MTWSIESPEFSATLILVDSPAAGTVLFKDGKRASIRGIDRALAVACEEPDVKAWLAQDGRLMIAVSSSYSAEVSSGIFSFRDGNQDQYLIQQASGSPDGSAKITRSFHSASGELIVESSETRARHDPGDLLADWGEVR